MSVARLSMLAALSLALGLAGCISSRSGVARAPVPFAAGATTRRDVVAAWGNPDVVLGDTWVWRNHQTIGGKLRASFMMVGATVKNLSRSAYEYRLRFGADGRLLSAEAVEYYPAGDEWSINPWK